jgi:hypothetical protein
MAATGAASLSLGVRRFSTSPLNETRWPTLLAILMSLCRLLKLLIVTSCIVPTAVAAEPSPIVRKARGVGIVYLLPFVALWQHDRPQGVSPKQLYTLAISRWLNDPEVTGQTGDTSIEPLVNAVITLGVDPAKRVLYGRGTTPNFDPISDSDSERFFVVTSDRAYYFRKREEWISFLREHCGVTKPNPKAVESLFQTFSKRA